MVLEPVMGVGLGQKDLVAELAALVVHAAVLGIGRLGAS